jgi:hypothetical protein
MCLQGQQREMGFSLIASYLGEKERILNFSRVVLGSDKDTISHG